MAMTIIVLKLRGLLSSSSGSPASFCHGDACESGEIGRIRGAGSSQAPQVWLEHQDCVG